MADPAMAPVMGLREAGALISARLVAHDTDGLSRFETGGGPVWLPRVAAAPGAVLRLRILAQDVMLATTRPEGISALNILTATVEEIRLGDGPGAIVRLRMGDEALLARITRRSVQALGLGTGDQVFAVLKSVSVAQDSVGATATTDMGMAPV
jgi:molybdate transport system ATP-binding protein